MGSLSPLSLASLRPPSSIKEQSTILSLNPFKHPSPAMATNTKVAQVGHCLAWLCTGGFLCCLVPCWAHSPGQSSPQLPNLTSQQRRRSRPITRALQHHPGFNVTFPSPSAVPGCRLSRGACTLPHPGTCSSAASQQLPCQRWSRCNASSHQTRKAARPHCCANAKPRFTRCSSWKGLSPLLGSHEQGEPRGPPRHRACSA